MIRPERAIGTTEPLPDIDLMQDTILYVFDVDRYYNAIWGGTDDKGQAVTVPKKYVVDTAGVMAGGMEDYNSNSSYVFCDLEQLKTLLRKEFRGSVIPGQPTTANGKAYKDIYYTSVIVNVDNMDYVQQVQNEINDMAIRPPQMRSGWHPCRDSTNISSWHSAGSVRFLCLLRQSGSLTQ